MDDIPVEDFPSGDVLTEGPAGNGQTVGVDLAVAVTSPASYMSRGEYLPADVKRVRWGVLAAIPVNDGHDLNLGYKRLYTIFIAVKELLT